LHPFTIAILLVAVGLFFDYCNGAHDSSNIVATMVSSRAISPILALIIASLFEFAGAYFLGTAVAQTIGKGIVNPEIIEVIPNGIIIVFAALIAAISLNLFTWYFGIPTSSSHALIGGLLGAFVVARGVSIVNWNRVTGIFLVLVASPIVGLVLGFLFTKIAYFFSQWSSPTANILFKRLQIGASFLLALSHGTNDAQKTMGVITFFSGRLGGLSRVHDPSSYFHNYGCWFSREAKSCQMASAQGNLDYLVCYNSSCGHTVRILLPSF